MPAQPTAKHPTKARVIVHPWVRLWARMFDYLIVSAVLVIIFDQFIPIWRGYYWLNLLWIPVAATVIWVPIEAWALHRWDTTPGKSLLRLSVVHEQQPHLRIPTALHRSLEVWVKGMGCGVIIVSQILWLISHRHLTRFGTTVWDEDCYSRVRHRPLSGGRIGLYIILFLLIDILTLGLTGQFSRLFLYVDVTLRY